MVDILAKESILALEGTPVVVVAVVPEFEMRFPSSSDDDFEENNALEPVRPIELLLLDFQALKDEDIR